MFATLDWRRHLHEWEAATDNLITPPSELPVQIRFIDALRIDWQSLEYGTGTDKDLRPMIQNALAGRP